MVLVSACTGQDKADVVDGRLVAASFSIRAGTRTSVASGMLIVQRLMHTYPHDGVHFIGVWFDKNYTVVTKDNYQDFEDARAAKGKTRTPESKHWSIFVGRNDTAIVVLAGCKNDSIYQWIYDNKL